MISTYDNELLDEAARQSARFESSLDPFLKRQTGSYYTDISLTLAMVDELIENLSGEELFSKRFFEPCVGTGNFVYAYLYLASLKKYSKEQYKMLLNNIYVSDVNQGALNIYKNNLQKFAKCLFDIELGEEYFSTHIGGGLLVDLNAEIPNYICLEDIFPKSVIKDGFDIIATNPPYKNLKAELGQYTSSEEYKRDKERFLLIGNIVSKNFVYSNAGILNIYKLFVEEITERYMSPNGICALLIPSSFLSDKTCTKLRTRILNTCALKSIRLLPESSQYVTSSQALCAVLYRKGISTTKIRIDGGFNGDVKQGVYVDIADILDEGIGNAILVLSDKEYEIRKKMRLFPKIKDLPYIKNLRGELDLTLNKKYITSEFTGYRLYRGRDIGYYYLANNEMSEFVETVFVENSAKKQYIENTRLACQQVVNIAKKRRIAFTIVPKGCVLGNSCNFICLQPNSDGVGIYFLLGVLNSSLIDWYFKLTSSNNHINNYEIDDFPIPVGFDRKSDIETKVLDYITTKDDRLLPQIDKLVYEAYGLFESNDNDGADNNMKADIDSGSLFNNKNRVINSLYHDLKCLIPRVTIEDCRTVIDNDATLLELSFQKGWMGDPFEKRVLDFIEQKYKKIASNIVLNHTTFKLSALDLEMIKSVPQGGSWRDIPKDIINKSRRLIRITETGGRTTLYGRIDYSKPSYTITTYFNRPGNGTYVHPEYERVLSVREAARFQSFPDDYYFCGNKTDMLKQVGNAVPVLLAYCIGRAIKEKTGCSLSVDLFSGAGGMTLGFKMAGIKAVIANDIEQSACITLKCNSPDIPVICGDITVESVKQKIIEAGKRAGAEIICGGPPCQGFSLAGFRREDDPRNQLFRHFIDIVSAINPKVIVFENVEGLLSFKGGETYHNIIELFAGLGYNTEGRLLMANHYGVPQRRKRVIILCTRKDLPYEPSDIYPKPITETPEKQVSAYNVLHDLVKVECSESAKYIPCELSTIGRYFKREITAEEYFNRLI